MPQAKPNPAKNNLAGRPREMAVEVIGAVAAKDGPHLDTVLEKYYPQLSDPKHRAWLLEITSGTLRWMGRLELAIDSLVNKKKPSGFLRKSLLIAAYQLIAQGTQPAVVVNEAVASVKAKLGDASAKFTNAVLRKLATQIPRWRDVVPANAQEASLPTWMWKKLNTAYGLEWTQAFANASLQRPRLWVRSRELSWRPDWATEGPVVGAWESTTGGSVENKAGYKEGQFIVQDISSQYLVCEVYDIVRDTCEGDMKALDLCAAPGGKSIGLAWNGFTVTATDVNEQRRMRLQENVDKSAAIRVKVLKYPEVDDLGNFELVWVDAPCTGSGTLRKNPEIRWNKQLADLENLVQIQTELVEKAWPKVRQGGFMVYSVCSVLKDEARAVIEKADLDGHIVKEWSLAPHLEPTLGGDGFYAAVLHKGLGHII